VRCKREGKAIVGTLRYGGLRLVTGSCYDLFHVCWYDTGKCAIVWMGESDFHSMHEISEIVVEGSLVVEC
jgi:hypothetical protein